MRTTVAIDEDRLSAARAIAEERHRTLDEVVSRLARQGPGRRTIGAEREGLALRSAAPGAGPVTPDLVDALRDDGP